MPHDVMKRSQSTGFSEHIVLTTDPVLTQFAVQTLPLEIQEVVFATAKIVPSRFCRSVALLGHAKGVAAVLQCLKPLLDDFTVANVKREIRSLDKNQFLHNLHAPSAWMESGDRAWLSMLGIALSKHPGFDGPRHSKKGELSAYFATIASAAEDGADWALRIIETFLIGSRTKEVRLKVPTPIRCRGEIVPLHDSAIPACQIFTFGNLPTIVSGRVFYNSIMDSWKKSKFSNGCTWLDPFLPGSIRLFYCRLWRTGLWKYDKLPDLVASERWDDEQLQIAVDDLQKIPLSVLDKFSSWPGQSFDRTPGLKLATPGRIMWPRFCLILACLMN